jgi:xylulokinase
LVTSFRGDQAFFTFNKVLGSCFKETMVITIGIDIGTSAVKAIIVSEQQIVVASATSPLDTQHPFEGAAVQNPDDWITATCNALKQLQLLAPQYYSLAVSIGLSGQMHGAVLLGANQTPLMPAMLWNDSRAAPEADAIAVNHPNLAEIAGVRCMASFVAPKILWLKRHGPQTLKLLRHILLPKDYVRLWMTGELATDMVDAAGSWFLDEGKRDWSSEILDLLELPKSYLPKLYEGNAVTGRLKQSVAEQLGLKMGVTVAAGAGDAAAGCLGVGILSSGDSLISLGTSCQLMTSTSTYQPAIHSLTHAYAHALPDLWFQMAAMLNGAGTLAWWGNICGRSPSQLLQEVDYVEPKNSSLQFLPYLSGERTPHNDLDARGSFIGLAAGDSRAHISLSIIEGVAFTLADAKIAIESGGAKVTSAGIVGGGSQSRRWTQLMADVLGFPISRFEDGGGGAALGAARLGRLAYTGENPKLVCVKPKILEVLQPNPDRTDEYNRKISIWREHYVAQRAIRENSHKGTSNHE